MSLKPIRTWPNQEHTYYVGSKTCKYLDEQFMFRIDLAAAYVYCRFADLQDRRLWIGNGNPLHGSCPENPTHNGRAVDVNYYTILPESALNEGQTPNATQYRPDGVECAQIWDGEAFLLNRFHFDANYLLFRILKELGITQYRTSDIIRQEYIRKGYDVTGMEGDFEFKYFHHTHAHIEYKP